MDAFSVGEWIISNWYSLAAFGMLAGGFIFTWRRQLGRSLLCFLACFGTYVIGGL